ncbi:hypothetical protein, partial [Kaarinaea lacus]
MGKPSKNELDSAFEEAKRLIWQEQDQDFLARSLFALHDQSEELTKVLSACEAYIRSGQSTTAHRGIISAMNAYRNMYSSNNADYVVSISDDERSKAIEKAGFLRESDNDQHFIAKTVLNLNYMVKQLENASEQYEKVAAVIGDGHVPGISELLTKKDIKFETIRLAE